MKGKILFIHGFGSCGKGNKVQALKRHFGERRLITPDLPVSPSQSIQQLQQLIERYQPDATISSSLGSYYATWLNKQYQFPAVLINPAVNAANLLLSYTGTHTHWCTAETFELTRLHIEELRQLYRPSISHDENYLVLLQDKDEVLDYRQAVEYYQGQQVIIEAGGNHRFENLNNYLTTIEAFFVQAGL
ncbi:MAG: hypothetical protein KJO91_11265 [Gammaproteobacteria bacterium]|nr:hypothetical protein [Gammaproteobacteria bacterium]